MHAYMANVSEMEKKKRRVMSLYEALGCGDVERAAVLLAADVEWWFHGPPGSHHMMRMLTGEATHEHFRFDPRSVTAVGDRVVAEGWAPATEGGYWVHVWRVSDGGVVTQLREYFDTWLVVTELRGLSAAGTLRAASEVWRSKPRWTAGRSLPELVLAI